MNTNQQFTVTAHAEGEGVRVSVTSGEAVHDYLIKDGSHAEYQRFFATLAKDIGSRPPHMLDGRRIGTGAPAD